MRIGSFLENLKNGSREEYERVEKRVRGNELK